ncbi:tripartite motif-containing protein 35 [Sphaeramia orbicularis]|uniref:Tripartite motif-containing protein 35-like n=1 Tax=Sphaeramia orbicularis TaxID=375764 RepID=A0A672YLH7_9TELE|nr:tripartite motif-containing protein 35-like [Sphaeramia orbicularis]
MTDRQQDTPDTDLNPPLDRGDDSREDTDMDSVDKQQDSAPHEEDSECPGCQTRGVVVLPCGHKLCPTCVKLSQGELGQAGCTICYGSQLMDAVLRTLLDALFQDQPRRRSATHGDTEQKVRGQEDGVQTGDAHVTVGSEELCEQHVEVLSVFCLEEEEPLCCRCQTEEHEDHQSCSIGEAVLHCKRELRSTIRNLQERFQTLTSIRQTWEDTAAHIKNQSVQTAQFLREEFEKMHQFLRDEEAALMSKLKQEEDEKSQRMRDKLDKISADIQALNRSIRGTQEAMGLEDIPFLKNYKQTCERAQCTTDEPAEEADTLLDVAKLQGCVQHRVWDKMQRIIQYFPVVLDPNTCSVCLSVSSDLASVFVGEEQHLPDNPERFVSTQSILGSESFTSGRHSWEVEVGDNSHWAVGVARETVHRKALSNADLSPSSASGSDTDPEDSMWTLSLHSGEYYSSSSPGTPLKLRRRPCRVRIQLDWERGCLTFSDANDNTLICRFKKQWSGPLKPYFSTTCSKHPLKIAAGRVTVTAE